MRRVRESRTCSRSRITQESHLPLAHYYFGSREGLIEALLSERVAPRIDDLVASARVRAGQPQLH